jgi:hypothetical protein
MKLHSSLLAILLCFTANSFAQTVTLTTHEQAVTRTTRDLASRLSGTIYYGGGPIMGGYTNVYVIYYGTWSTTSRNIINGWLQHIGGSSYYNVDTRFQQSNGINVQNVVNYNPTTNSYSDNYSLGKSLTDATTQTIVSNAIRGGHLPNDPTNGVYFVLTAADVSQTSSNGTLCVQYCGYHSPSNSIVTGETIKYSIVGNFAACPSACDGNIFNGDSTTPNGDIGGDGAINVMFHELSESVSDPNVTFSNGAWGADVTEEAGDFCNFYFGTFSSLPRAANGAHYNITLGGVNYLEQQMFEILVSRPGVGYYNGSCAASLTPLTPPAPPTACGTITAGHGLIPLQVQKSCDGRFVLNMQNDSNLVLYEGSTPLWNTNTVGTDTAFAVMQGDGNFVTYNTSGAAVFNTGTSGHPGAYIVVQNDGNLVIYVGSTPIWSSNTCCH